ncbi:ABC transporter permease [Arsenicitalea aurantiaca]|uniref:ABC transporter permease n=1 Tax=Arsenicitalea aurantiaca TaxID=1783274 RepID=A0A433XBH3_9HYPH|nr:ABC transporter permease [Arsenicitalea aurantiaca]RUT31413.1 ABC transporter permease [Arsenicitalea aurantiaca]
MSNLTRAAVLVILFVIVAPLAVPVMMSVSDTPFMTFPPQGFTLRWYWKVLAEPEVQQSLWVSIRLAAAAAIGSLILGIPCAIGLVRYRVPGRNAILGLVLSPLIVPLLVTGLALLQFFSLAGNRWTFFQLAMGHIVICLPYVVRNVSNSLLLANPDLESAARIMGADRWTTFRRVTWHQIRPGITSGAIFAFIVSFDDFPISMWLADAREFPLPLFLEVAIQRFFDPSIAALSTLMILLALVMIGVMEALLGIKVRRFAG